MQGNLILAKSDFSDGSERAGVGAGDGEPVSRA